MTQIDIAIVIVIAVSAVLGLWRGFIREVLSLLNWVVALVVARLYSEPLAELLSGLIANSSIRYATAFGLLFVVVFLLGGIVIHYLSKLQKLSGIQYLDKFLGGLFGVLRGLVVVTVVLVILNLFFSETLWWRESTLIPSGVMMIEQLQSIIGDVNGTGSAL